MSKKQSEINEADDEELIIVTAPIIIEDGKHSGIISNVISNIKSEERQYDYLDVEVEFVEHDKKPKVKVGFPANISELSSLGRLLIKSGMQFIEGDNITIKSIKDQLVGKGITFLTKTDKTEKGNFARILAETIEFN